MKNILLTTIIVSILVFFSGCANENEIVVDSPTIENSSLIKELDSFNAKILRDKGICRTYNMNQPEPSLSQNPVTRLSRGWGVAWSDAKGTFGGARVGGKLGATFGPHSAVIMGGLCAILCGSVASFYTYSKNLTDTQNSLAASYAYLQKTGQLYNPEIIYAAYLKIDDKQKINIVQKSDIAFITQSPVSFQQTSIVGVQHNAVIENLKNPELLQKVNIDKSSIEYKVISSNEFKTEYKKCVDNCLNNSYENEIVLYMNNPNYLYTQETAKVMDLFMEVYNNYPEKMEDVDFLVNYYVSKIEASDEFKSIDKTGLYSALSVAMYSPRLWENELHLSE